MSAPQFADFVADAVLATDAQFRVTYWNAAAARISGWPATEALGRHALDLLRVAFLDSSHDEVMRALAGGGRWTGILSETSRDGRVLVCDAVLAALPEGAGYAIVLRDLAERQHLEEGRRQAEQRLASALAFNANLLDAAPVGILTYRISGECVSCNPAAARMVGGTTDELRQQNFRQLKSWAESGLLDLAEKAIATRLPQAAEIAMITSYGRSLWVLARVAVFRAQDDDLLLLAIGDITDLKRVEEELTETERVLRASQLELRKLSRVIEQNPSAIVITDRSGNIEYVNPSFSTLSGYSAAEVIGQNPRIFKSGETSGEAYRILWSTINSGATWRGELRNKSKSGELYWLRATISPILDDRGTITHFVAIQENIGGQKAAEAAAAESERRFLGAQKMEAVGQLAGGIAHDFNNLLTAILGYTDFVLDGVRADPVLTSDVQEIKKAGERAARLTRQLLAFSRRQRLEPENVNLNSIVDELAKMVGRVIGENIQLDVATDEALGLAKLDPGQIEQVVMNLVVNARDAMPDGGLLSIRTANVQLGDEFIQHHPGARAGPQVAISVADTGMGMPPEIQARIFEPFFTTKALGHGTGLGLATVYGIVKQSNGYVMVESQPGAGTTFTIFFPRLGADATVATVDVPGSAPLRGTETVLVAEDEAGLRQVIQRTLEQYGYKVLLASTGVEALDVERRYRGAIDLLLSDVVMPNLGGPDVAQRLSRRRPLMKVLYMSGFDQPVAGAGSSVDARAAFLSKPFTPEGLVRRVREVLNRPRAGTDSTG